MQPHTYEIMYAAEQTHWWFAGRRRIIESFVAEMCRRARLARPRILDVGCGTGANLQMLCKHGEAEGLDISNDALDFCRRRKLPALVRHGCAEHLPYEDETFDFVMALDVIEHLDDDVAALREIRRVLRRGGQALLFVPAFMFLWGAQDVVSCHRRRYTRASLRRLITDAGLAIERVTYANISFFAPVLLGRLLMRAFHWQPRSENNINIQALNPLLGRIFGAESLWLQRSFNFPFGVSLVAIARRIE